MEPVALSPQSEIIQKKREAWGNLGVAVYKIDLQLQAASQSAIEKLAFLPVTIADVPQAERTLKQVNSERIVIKKRIKEVTDGVKERIKILNKSDDCFDKPMADYYNAIVALKRTHEAQQALNKQKADELKRIREQLTIMVADIDARFKTAIADKVDAAYKYALENIAPEKLERFLQQASAKLTITDFAAEMPPITAEHSTMAETSAIIDELFTIDAATYVSLYHSELQKRFVDYAVAYNNKQQALQLAEQETQKARHAISQQQQHTAIAAQLECQSTELQIEPAGLRDLKKAYKIDMPETEESAFAILSAYAENRTLCSSKLRVTKWLSFSVTNAITAVEKVKNEDNGFAPGGITFKEIEKL